MTPLPRLTLVTPSYNQAAYLERTIRSVIDQDYPALQYLILDGGSTDGSVEIIRRYERYLDGWVSQPDGGQSDAINQGFARADGEIMTWLNSDDVLLPGALRLAGEIFARWPEIAWLTGQPANLDVSDHLRRSPLRVGRFRSLIRRGWYHGRGLGFIRQEGTFWRRSLWDQAGGHIAVARRYAMDFELWGRLAAHADLVSVDVPLAAFRVQPQQKTALIDRYYAEAGITLPHAARLVMLPLRALFTLATWPLAPRVLTAGGLLRFRPGPTFRSSPHP
jgi:glycosyltransferase involved in cell wall biosynthesis